MEALLNLKIAVDFDGTIVEHAYPSIGKERLFAFKTLKELQNNGALLVLWTFRSGKELEEAVTFCEKNGLEFYAVNSSYPGEVFDSAQTSRKIDADVYIDDKNVGGFPGWGEIWHMLMEDEQLQKEYEKSLSSSANPIKRLLKKLFSNG